MLTRPLLIHKDHLKSYSALLALPEQVLPAQGQERPQIQRPSAIQSIRNAYSIQNGVAVIPVKSYLIAEDWFYASWFGATSIEQLSANIHNAAQDHSVQKIVLDINSPGGDSDGIPELADYIVKARLSKPIIAYAHNVCASGAYWLASACDTIIASRATFLGSIGALLEIKNSNDDTLCISSNVSPRKAPEAGDHSEAQEIVNYLGKLFVEFVAKNRLPARPPLTAKQIVVKTYGQGSVLDSQKALGVRMIDQIGQLPLDLSTLSDTRTKKLMSKNKTGTRSSADKTKTAFVIVDDENVELPENAEVMPLDEVTTDWIKENLPDIAQELIAEGAEGVAEQEQQEEDGNDAPINEDETSTANGSAQTVRHIQKIMAINVFNEKERDLQKKAVSQLWSEARYCMELTTLRAKHTSALMQNHSKDAGELATNVATCAVSESEYEQVKPLLGKAKSTFKTRLKTGGLT